MFRVRALISLAVPLHSLFSPQVMIPDVQKLINQSGNVSVDIFNTRLIKPPTSVLVFPLKARKGHGAGGEVVEAMQGVLLSKCPTLLPMPP